jgi:inositol-phosphate phosphatase/L-galactose 1-phosphate phosphatase/histidinol-phosphatase
MSDLLPEFIDFAHSLADAAGSIIRPLFRNAVAVDVKDDSSPVTKADREAERIMRDLIMTRYNDHGIWGEEFGIHNKDAKYCWILDPIDGTKSFISGLPVFGTLISLTRLGVPVLGIIDQPVNNERWIGGASLATTFNGKNVKTRACHHLKLATLSTTSPHLFNAEDKLKFKQVRKHAKYMVYGYDCYAYAQLASGFIDAVVETGLKPHDFCALRPVIENAGGIITDWDGKPLTLVSDGRVIAAGDKKLHAEILALIKESL